MYLHIPAGFPLCAQWVVKDLNRVLWKDLK